MILKTGINQFTRVIYDAGVRAGRAIERDNRWFTNHDFNYSEVLAANKESVDAFERLIDYILFHQEGTCPNPSGSAVNGSTASASAPTIKTST